MPQFIGDLMKMKILRSMVIVILVVMVVGIGVAAQAPQGGGQGAGAGRGAGSGSGRGGQRGPVLNVTSPAWPDGGEVPMKYAGRGGNTSPAFEFNWMQGTTPAMPPTNLASYLIIFHD